MKILIFYQYFGTPNGGWSTRYYEFTRRWVKEGHQVTVVTSPYYKSDIKPAGFISRQWVEGVQLIVINSPDSNKDTFAKRAWNALRFAVVAQYYALAEPHDVVLSSSGPITTAIPGLLSKWFKRNKLVFEVRDLWPRGGIEMGKLKSPLLKKTALAFERLIYRQADLVIACSKGMEDGVLAICPATKTLVIPNSSDVELFSVKSEIAQFPEGFNSKAPVFLYAGSLGEMDDCSQILKGLAQVRGGNFNMVFIGDGAEKKMLETLSSSLGLRDKIFFLGLLPKTEVVKWFGMARASFVTFQDIPVLHTNSPNKLFDSFAAGVPVIQTTKGWIAELIQQEGGGFSVDPAAPDEMAKVVEQLIQSPELAAQKGLEALRLATAQFNRNELAKKFQLGMENLVS